MRLAHCAADLRSTRPRREVLRALGGEPVRALERAGHALASADELGSPLAATLSEQAALQRELTRLGVRERAAAAGPKMALVVAVTLVPSALVLVLGSQALALLAGV
jgi:pilus assembly protein TadC